ncbi:MAG: LytTR family transcriptional regulator [Sphingobacteriales bacterium]|nr:MAG: LytTR family transcriptional regulator [Sphingobacteriales bacterium]
MRRFKITIIDHQLTDIFILSNIMDNCCMDVVDVSYHLSIEDWLFSLDNNKPDIVILNYILLDIIDHDLLIENDISLIVMAEEDKMRPIPRDRFPNLISKPFKVENIVLCINKVVKLKAKNLEIPLIRTVKADLLTIVSLDRTDFIEVKDILFCMAEGRYTTFHLLGGKKIMSSKNLGEYEKQLDGSLFYRIHHGYIVNVSHMTRLIRTGGNYCEITNHFKIPIAKRKQALFSKFIKGCG